MSFQEKNTHVKFKLDTFTTNGSVKVRFFKGLEKHHLARPYQPSDAIPAAPVAHLTGPLRSTRCGTCDCIAKPQGVTCGEQKVPQETQHEPAWVVFGIGRFIFVRNNFEP